MFSSDSSKNLDLRKSFHFRSSFYPKVESKTPLTIPKSPKLETAKRSEKRRTLLFQKEDNDLNNNLIVNFNELSKEPEFDNLNTNLESTPLPPQNSKKLTRSQQLINTPKYLKILGKNGSSLLDDSEILIYEFNSSSVKSNFNQIAFNFALENMIELRIDSEEFFFDPELQFLNRLSFKSNGCECRIDFRQYKMERSSKIIICKLKNEKCLCSDIYKIDSQI
ncbi:unnamed protein product [Brachionus calyciflorus]|uniref:Uncharacterized protein n=1 Tax=Brachionus calyciflorus TaxID=104777 RepID=A0A814BA88_9BILA|nr:unnamed protein product [Brachionus calyciflorus]